MVCDSATEEGGGSAREGWSTAGSHRLIVAPLFKQRDGTQGGKLEYKGKNNNMVIHSEKQTKAR